MHSLISEDNQSGLVRTLYTAEHFQGFSDVFRKIKIFRKHLPLKAVLRNSDIDCEPTKLVFIRRHVV